MKTNNKKKSAIDFREFVFTATGREIDPTKVSAIDLFDNLIVELDRLHALADLLSMQQDHLEAETVSGLSLLLKDIERRQRVILESFDRSRARDKP